MSAGTTSTFLCRWNKQAALGVRHSTPSEVSCRSRQRSLMLPSSSVSRKSCKKIYCKLRAHKNGEQEVDPIREASGQFQEAVAGLFLAVKSWSSAGLSFLNLISQMFNFFVCGRLLSSHHEAITFSGCRLKLSWRLLTCMHVSCGVFSTIEDRGTIELARWSILMHAESNWYCSQAIIYNRFWL